MSDQTEIIDRKFKVLAVNPVNGKIYTEKDGFFICAKDAAAPNALASYLVECERIGANKEHIESIRLLLERVHGFQIKHGARTPDTIGDEIARCIDGIGVD